MRHTLSVIFGSILILSGISPLLAADMYCGDHLIEGDQPNGMSREQIRKLCGEPDGGEAGGDWTYNKDGSTYHI